MKWLRIAFVFIMVAIVLISGARMLDTGFAAAPDAQAGPPNPLSLDKANLIDPGAGSSGPQIQTDRANSPKQLAPGGDLPCGGVYFSTAETFVRQNLPNTNFDEAELRVSQGSPSNGSERVFMKFDLTDAVPAGASIQRAELELNLFQDPQPITYTLQVFSHQHPDWSEEELTWSTQPALTLDFAPATYAITHTQAVSSVVRLDVTTWATLWATGAITHTGLTVAPAGSAAMAVSFHSSETERGILLAAPENNLFCKENRHPAQFFDRRPEADGRVYPPGSRIDSHNDNSPGARLAGIRRVRDPCPCYGDPHGGGAGALVYAGLQRCAAGGRPGK